MSSILLLFRYTPTMEICIGFFIYYLNFNVREKEAKKLSIFVKKKQTRQFEFRATDEWHTDTSLNQQSRWSDVWIRGKSENEKCMECGSDWYLFWYFFFFHTDDKSQVMLQSVDAVSHITGFIVNEYTIVAQCIYVPPA